MFAPRSCRVPLLLTALLPLSAGGLRAQVPDSMKPIEIGQRIIFHSKVLGEDRPLQIRLPFTYATTVDDRFPVLFVLDGEARFTGVTGIVADLYQGRRAPDMIVVGIANTKDRTHDLAPPAADTVFVARVAGVPDANAVRIATAGGAAKFLDFLADELIPWIDAHYRTLPYRVLVGHSLGGLFAIDALMLRPAAFNGYVAASPSLWWDDGRFAAEAAHRLPSSSSLDGRALYATTGEFEGARMIDPATSLMHALAQTHPTGFRSWYRIMPGESHVSNPHLTIYEGLDSIFCPWAVPDSIANRALLLADLGPLEAHLEALSGVLGFRVPLPESALETVGEILVGNGHVEEGLLALRRAVTEHPTSPFAYDALARGLKQADRRDEAVRAEQEAMRRARAMHLAAQADGFRAFLAELKRK